MLEGLLWLIVLAAWIRPRAVGSWLANIKRGYDARQIEQEAPDA